MKPPHEMSGSELLDEFCERRTYMRQVERARAKELPVRGHGSPFSPRGYYDLPRPGQGPIMVDVPSPELDARWSEIRAEIDRRLRA